MSIFVLREQRQSKAEDSRSRMLTDDVRGWGAGRPAPQDFFDGSQRWLRQVVGIKPQPDQLPCAELCKLVQEYQRRMQLVERGCDR